jgi:hypothetical protein
MGMTFLLRCLTHAIASWAGVHPFFSAIFSRASTIARFLSNAYQEIGSVLHREVQQIKLVLLPEGAEYAQVRQ